MHDNTYVKTPEPATQSTITSRLCIHIPENWRVVASPMPDAQPVMNNIDSLLNAGCVLAFSSKQTFGADAADGQDISAVVI